MQVMTERMSRSGRDILWSDVCQNRSSLAIGLEQHQLSEKKDVCYLSPTEHSTFLDITLLSYKYRFVNDIILASTLKKRCSRSRSFPSDNDKQRCVIKCVRGFMVIHAFVITQTADSIDVLSGNTRC